MLGMFLAALDQTIVATAIRTIGDDLHGLSRPGLGHHRVPDHLDDRHPAVRQAVRHLRAQAVLPDRDHRSSSSARRCAACRDVDVHAGRVPRLPGHRRRRPVLAGAGDHRRHHPAARAGPVPGLLHGRLRHVERARSRSSAASSPGRPSILGITGWRWIFYINVPIGHRRPGRRQPRAARLAPRAARPPHRLGRRRRARRRPGAAADHRRAGPRLGLGVSRRRSPATSLGVARPRRVRAASRAGWATRR